jgi:MFS transporter, SHS family, sialic acid transporter
VLFLVPESPQWVESKKQRTSPDRQTNHRKSLFRPPLLRVLLTGILLGSIPLIGAWSASKWMIPWADSVSGTDYPGYKAQTQGWWALGAVLGSFSGAQIAHAMGRRISYAVISLGATCLTWTMFLGTAPLEPLFLPVVLVQGFVSTLFFGWLPLYLPGMFPVEVRAAGSGIAFNSGRFATAFGVFAAGSLLTLVDGSYPHVGAICGSVYLLGMFAVWLLPREPGQ